MADNAPTREIGYAQTSMMSAGTTMNWWMYDDETTPELRWPQSVYIYDQMRRTDAQVASVLRAVSLPVRRTPWRIDPAGARPEVVQLVAEDLGLPIVGKEVNPLSRARDRFSWLEHLREALLMLPFGHMFFEQNVRIVDGKARLRKLAARMPKTLEAIDVARDGGLKSIKQYSVDSMTQPAIPVERLVAYVHDREAGNWLGTSLLRPAYKHWLLKDRLLRVQAQTIERNGMGIPVYTAAETERAADMATGLALATSLRSGDAAGARLPFGATLKLMGVEGTLPDAQPAIDYHDSQIARAVLAHFLNLGTQTGSWALGSTFADFFTLSLQTLAQQIADVATQHVVEDMVDWNFGENEPAPRIVFDEIGSRQAATAEAIKSLIDAGVITADDVLEGAVRQQYGLPPRDEATERKPPEAAGPTPPAQTQPDERPGSVAASAEVTAKFNPHQLRDGEGQWTDGTPGVGVVAIPGDKLKLAKRAPTGFSVRSSRKLKTDYADVGIAEVDGPDGPHVRVGLLNRESGKWDAGFTGETRKATLRQQIAEKRALFDSDEEAPADIEDQISELESELEDLDNERTAVLTPELMTNFQHQLGDALEAAKANKARVDADTKAQEAIDEKRDALIAEHSDPALERQIREASWSLRSKLQTIERLETGPNPSHWTPEDVAELLEDHRADVPGLEATLAPLLARRAELMPANARARLEDLDRQWQALNERDITDIITTTEVSTPSGTRVRAEIWGSDDIDDQWTTTRLFVLTPDEAVEDVTDVGDDYGYFPGLKGLNKLIALLDTAVPVSASGPRRSVRSRAPRVRARFDPHQPRDPGGEDGGQWISAPGSGVDVIPGDKLKLGSRIQLGSGEKLVSSRKIKTDDESYNLLAAEVDTPGGRQVRLGIISPEASRHWAAGPDPKRTRRLAEIHTEINRLEDQDGLSDADEARLGELDDERRGLSDDDNQFSRTAVLTPAAVAELRARIAEGAEAGHAHKKAFDAFWDGPNGQRSLELGAELNRRLRPYQDKPSFAVTDDDRRHIAEIRAEFDAEHGGEMRRLDALEPASEQTFVEGFVPGGPEGDLHYRVEAYDNGDGGWDIDLGIKPPDADDDWSIGDNDDKSAFEGSNVKGLLKALGELSGDQPNPVKAHLQGLHPQDTHGRRYRVPGDRSSGLVETKAGPRTASRLRRRADKLLNNLLDDPQKRDQIHTEVGRLTLEADRADAAQRAQELDELKASLSRAAAAFAARSDRQAGPGATSTSTPTRMTKAAYTKVLKAEQVRLHMLDGKSEKEAKAFARPTASIDDLKARNTELRKALRRKGVDYRTDEQRRADDSEKNTLLDEVERLAAAGGHDGAAKRAAASRMSKQELSKFVADVKDFQRRQKAKADAPSQAAFDAVEAKFRATDRQVGYIVALLRQRGGSADGPTSTEDIRKLSNAQASAYIRSLGG